MWGPRAWQANWEKEPQFQGLRVDDDGKGMGHGAPTEKGKAATGMTKLMMVCADTDYDTVSDDQVRLHLPLDLFLASHKPQDTWPSAMPV